jgi:hypothetical protein
LKVTPSTYIIGFVIFLFFIVGGINLIGLGQNQDPTIIDGTTFQNFNKTFAKTALMDSKVNQLKETITTQKTGWSAVTGFFDTILGTIWNSIKLIFDSFSFLPEILTQIGVFFGLPAWIAGLTVTLITIMLIFAIWYAFLRVNI